MRSAPIGHVHGGALGWVAFMTFGMAYWLAPRVFQTPLYSVRLATAHFWIALVGIVLYVLSMWNAGITQGLMWRAFDESGDLAYSDFVETVLRLMPMYWVRAMGGVLFLGSTLLCGFNLVMTWRRRPERYTETEVVVPPLAREQPKHQDEEDDSPLRQSGRPVVEFAYTVEKVMRLRWHRGWEGLPLKFTVLVVIAVVVATLFELLPTFLIQSNVPTIASVKPYTALELYGRDIYLREGCYNCHSQMVRPFRAETERYGGEYSKPGEFVYDRPFQWGSRRIGPDLHRVGGFKYPHLWHVKHMRDPRSTTEGSIMPVYPWLLDDPIDLQSMQRTINAMATLGVPYSEAELAGAKAAAQQQAKTIAEEIAAANGPKGLADREITALIAYLQRLGSDIELKDDKPKAGAAKKATAGAAGGKSPEATVAAAEEQKSSSTPGAKTQKAGAPAEER